MKIGFTKGRSDILLIKNKLRISSLLLGILFVQCAGRQDFYHGYVYDRTTNKPLNQVLIKENFKVNPKSTFTNSDGYFKLKRNKVSIAQLIFSLNGFKDDTAVTIWAQHGEQIMYRFLNKKPDTLFLSRENQK